jgi:hypothetical protein
MIEDQAIRAHNVYYPFGEKSGATLFLASRETDAEA